MASNNAKFAFVLSHEQFPASDLIEFGIAAEKAGFDGVWTSDHFQPWQDNEGHAGFAWITLAALAAKTEKIFFGTGVTCPTFRYHPAVVAQAFAALGELYPGRVFLGVGSGEALNEQAATGQWGDYDERADRFVEAVQLIRELWTGDIVTHEGQYYQTHKAKLYLNPAQPVPLYMAAAGELSAGLAGQYGDGWITDSETALKKEDRDAFEQGAQLAGKDPATMPILAEHFVCVGDKEEAKKYAPLWQFLPNAWSDYVNVPDPREIERRALQEVEVDKLLEKWVVAPDAQTHIEALQKLIDGGVTHIFIHSAQPDQKAVIEFFGTQVLPKLR